MEHLFSFEDAIICYFEYFHDFRTIKARGQGMGGGPGWRPPPLTDPLHPLALKSAKSEKSLKYPIIVFLE